MQLVLPCIRPCFYLYQHQQESRTVKKTSEWKFAFSPCQMCHSFLLKRTIFVSIHVQQHSQTLPLSCSYLSPYLTPSYFPFPLPPNCQTLPAYKLRSVPMSAGRVLTHFLVSCHWLPWGPCGDLKRTPNSSKNPDNQDFEPWWSADFETYCVLPNICYL